MRLCPLRYVPAHNGALFFGTAEHSGESDSGVQSIGFTKDDGTLRFYRDDALIGTRTGVKVVPVTTTNAAIGHWNLATDRNWEGEIDYLYQFGLVLTDAERPLMQEAPHQILGADFAAARSHLRENPRCLGFRRPRPVGRASLSSRHEQSRAIGASWHTLIDLWNRREISGRSRPASRTTSNQQGPRLRPRQGLESIDLLCHLGCCARWPVQRMLS
jgi:hypothetical protein